MAALRWRALVEREPQSMIDGYRRAAMRLRALGTADRAWVLGRLLPEERERIEVLLEELDALHGDTELQAFSDLARSELLETAPTLADAPATIVTHAEPEQVTRVLADEPDWLVVRVCAIARWPWLPAFLAQLERARAARVAALMRDVSPAKRSLENALVAAVAARLRGDLRNGFDALLSAEQRREPRTAGLRSRVTRWLR